MRRRPAVGVMVLAAALALLVAVAPDGSQPPAPLMAREVVLHWLWPAIAPFRLARIDAREIKLVTLAEWFAASGTGPPWATSPEQDDSDRGPEIWAASVVGPTDPRPAWVVVARGRI